MHINYSILFLLSAIQLCSSAAGTAEQRKTCTVEAGGSNATDDAPAIYDAFDECKSNGRVVFENTTYYINSVMNISALEDVEVDIYGTLLVIIESFLD